MSKYLFFILVFVFYSNIFAQGQDIYFKNQNIVWAHNSLDTSKLKNNLTFFSEDHYLIKDGFLYIVYTNLSLGGSGGYIEKLNVNNGNLIWSNYFDLTNNDQKEIPTYLGLNDDNNIELVCFRSNGDSTFVGFWSKGKFSKRIYDNDSGKLLYYYYAPNLNNDAPLLLVYGDLTKIRPIGDNYIYYYSEASLDSIGKIGLFTLKLNNKGELLSKKEKLYPIEFKKYSTNVKYRDETFYLYRQYSTESFDSVSTYIDILDKNLNTTENLDLTNKDYTKDKYSGLSIVSNIGYDITGLKKIPNSTERILSFTHFDKKGEVVESFSLPKITFYGYSNLRLTDSDNSLIFVSYYNHNEKACNINIYKSDGNSNLTLIKQIQVENKLNFSINKVFETQDSNFILIGTSSKIINDLGQTETDYYRNFIVKISGKSFVNTEETEYDNISFLSYPNPVKNELNIKFKNSFTGVVLILDIVGQKIISKRIKESLEQTIEVSSLKEGMYFIKLKSDKNNTNFDIKGFIKKM